MAISSSNNDSDEVLSEINITPMVDVMLVLLVVFIITAPLMTNSITVNLPKTESTPQVQQPEKPLTLSIDANGLIFLDKEEFPIQFVEEELAARKAANPDIRLSLNADEAVSYGVVAKIMVIIERAGIDKLAVITQQDSL
ncbi:ExbD/TolR family protein [Cellvibrio japonicus]|uniref:ExbD n=1 Tax=Cellvibrio japonicus (strain Ueda107) TaxID=498211 RepID=B3PJW7_CELJU|nr:biopolymer transporter ExbD [Cellvibrio japonicus]ACE84263.1 ExbD [Cellvibrio japonicus Ueda107]QEI12744.1 biopolymer transporter ExbD [Cellvibrio japonicus]QEI16318.1 biopolymer transporter ExbD [Cellvibrio japonicus]QEI19896.1 biopolymer transporter ExbD [Cellvibrio japonicus]